MGRKALYCLLHSLRGIWWHPSSRLRRVQSWFQAYLTNKSSITGNQELAAAELRVHVPILNDKSPWICARPWHKKPPADPMGLAGQNPAPFLNLFYCFGHCLLPKSNCMNGPVSLWLSIRNWLQDTNLIGTPLCPCSFLSLTNDYLVP